ncbi:uncharacterized protein LY89DRAFT_780661 [Mollisia scopiformis]|uniref:Uncharacterized protein n=1 Tax=Mollisia scopiformis TaxID=149040 RepID=A0A194XEM3_MOLSC|nr:uncharacterized protein LY89DRAFT_780661 [Mollisia scopiformis]KUJ18623.1 hypothetical protein LY89DRAFT_780661 [Mollisia scopiformis]
MISSISPRAWYFGKLTVILLSILLTTSYLISHSFSSTPSVKDLYALTTKGKKALFIENFLSTEIDGPFDNKTLVALCNAAKWQPGLIFECEVAAEGVVNVRNVILNCVRYTILAGATSFILPTLLTTTTPPTTLLMSHLFDSTHFTAALTSSCPQITLIPNKNDLYNLPSTAHPIALSPTSISTSPLLLSSILTSPQTWPADLAVHINKTHPSPFSPQKPLLITLQTPLLEFPLSYDEKDLVSNFGKLIRPNEDIRRVAAAVLFALYEKYRLDLVFSPSGGVQAAKFMGVHLRVGKDAEKAGWTSAEVQTSNALSLAATSELGLIYLSSFDPELFVTTAPISSIPPAAARPNSNSSTQQSPPPPPTTETATSLLSGPLAPGTFLPPPTPGFESEWAALRALEWQQALLVDYEVLLRSSIFAGTWESSFSWNVALRRSLVGGNGGKEGSWEGVGNGNGKGVVVEKVGRDGVGKGKGRRGKKGKVGEVCWKDERSTVFGPGGEGGRVRGALWG